MTQLKRRFLDVVRVPGLSALISIYILVGMAFSFFNPFLSIFAVKEVGMTNTEFGIFMTISSVCGVLITMVLGRLSDSKVSRKAVLILSATAGIFCFGLFAFVRDYVWLLAIHSFFFGLASGSIPQLFALVREMLTRSSYPDREIPFAINVFRMFFALAWTLGPAVAGFILLYFDYRGLFLCVAFAHVLILVLVMLCIQKTKPDETAQTYQPVQMRRFLTRPFISANMVAFTLIFAASSIGMMNIPLFLVDVLDSSEKHVGFLFSVPPVFEVPFMIWLGILATRKDIGAMIRVGFMVYVIYFLLLFTVQSVWFIYPLQILSAFVISITMGIAITYFQNFLPNEQGTATTLFTNTTRIGNMLGFMSFGLLADWLHYRNVFLACMLLSLISLGLLFIVRHHSVRQQANEEAAG